MLVSAMDNVGGRAARARLAFDRAVAAERKAILKHEQAALLHESAARRLDEAVGEPYATMTRRAALAWRAAAEHQLALAERRKADEVRGRLRAEGIAPDR